VPYLGNETGIPPSRRRGAPLFIVGSQAVDMAVMVGAYNESSPPEHVPHVSQRTSGSRRPRARVAQAGTGCSPRFS